MLIIKRLPDLAPPLFTVVTMEAIECDRFPDKAIVALKAALARRVHGLRANKGPHKFIKDENQEACLTSQRSILNLAKHLNGTHCASGHLNINATEDTFVQRAM